MSTSLSICHLHIAAFTVGFALATVIATHLGVALATHHTVAVATCLAPVIFALLLEWSVLAAWERCELALFGELSG